MYIFQQKCKLLNSRCPCWWERNLWKVEAIHDGASQRSEMLLGKQNKKQKMALISINPERQYKKRENSLSSTVYWKSLKQFHFWSRFFTTSFQKYVSFCLFVFFWGGSLPLLWDFNYSAFIINHAFFFSSISSFTILQ